MFFKIKNLLLCFIPIFLFLFYSMFVYIMGLDYASSTRNFIINIILLLAPPVYWSIINYNNIKNTIKGYASAYIYILILSIIYLFFFQTMGNVSRHQSALQIPTGKSLGLTLFIIKLDFFYITFCCSATCIIKYIRNKKKTNYKISIEKKKKQK